MTNFTPEALAAINRLATHYNGRSYDVTTNPGGFANDGHSVNFEPCLRDLAAVGTAVAAEGGAVRTLAGEVQDNADAVAEIAADPGLVAVGLDLASTNTIGTVAAIAAAVSTVAGAIEPIQAAPAAAAAAIQAAQDAETARQAAVTARNAAEDWANLAASNTESVSKRRYALDGAGGEGKVFTLADGRVTEISDTVFGLPRLETIAYDGAGTATSITRTWSGFTRTETYTWTAGELTGITVTEE